MRCPRDIGKGHRSRAFAGGSGRPGSRAPSWPRRGISETASCRSSRRAPDRRRAARAAYEAARDDVVYRQLAELPLARLKETTQGRLRLGSHRGRRVPYRRPGGRRRRSRAPADTRGRSPDGNPGHSRGPPALQRDDAARPVALRSRCPPAATGQAAGGAQSIRGSAPGSLAGPREPRRDGRGARCRPGRVEARGQPPADVLLRFAQARRSPERSQPA